MWRPSPLVRTTEDIEGISALWLWHEFSVGIAVREQFHLISPQLLFPEMVHQYWSGKGLHPSAKKHRSRHVDGFQDAGSI
jgi:hypothetical protein